MGTKQFNYMRSLRVQQMVRQIEEYRILDINCSKFTPVLRTLSYRSNNDLELYVGTDYHDEVLPFTGADNIGLVLERNLDFSADYWKMRQVCENIFGDKKFAITCFESIDYSISFLKQVAFIENLARLMWEFRVDNCYFVSSQERSKLSHDLITEMFAAAGLHIFEEIGLCVTDEHKEYDNLPAYFNNGTGRAMIKELQGLLPHNIMSLIWGSLISPELSDSVLYILHNNAGPTEIDMDRLVYYDRS